MTVNKPDNARAQKIVQQRILPLIGDRGRQVCVKNDGGDFVLNPEHFGDALEELRAIADIERIIGGVCSNPFLIAVLRRSVGGGV